MAKIFSDIKGGVKSAITTTKKKTKSMAEVAKLKLDIKMEESSLDHCFEQLGRAVYANSKTGNNSERVDELLKKAEKISADLKEYRQRLAFIQGKRVCPHCEIVITADGPCEFCSEKIVKNEKNTDPVDDFEVNSGEEQDEQILVVDDE